MPVPSQGDGRVMEVVASGTVTRGDILSGTPLAAARNTTRLPILGVALADSTKSINGKITVALPGADQAFFCDVPNASTLAAGDEIIFTRNGGTGKFEALPRGATAIEGRVLRGVNDITQVAGARKVLVQIVRSATVQVYT
jgi:hypothetical protein